MEDVPVGFRQVPGGSAGYKSRANGTSYSTQKRASKSNPIGGEVT